jgi:hypothetical protein
VEYRIGFWKDAVSKPNSAPTEPGEAAPHLRERRGARPRRSPARGANQTVSIARMFSVRVEAASGAPIRSATSPV